MDKVGGLNERSRKADKGNIGIMNDEMGSAYATVFIIFGLALWKLVEIIWWLLSHIRISIV